MDRSRGALLVALLATAWLLNFGHPLSSDEGTTLAGAWNVVNGRRLYVDFFEFDAPGAYVLTALSFRLLGAAYWSAKALGLGLLAASGVAVGFVAERLGASRASAAGAAVAWVTLASLPGIVVNHNAMSAFVAAVALALAADALRAPDRASRWALAGMTLGLVPLFHQSKGLALVASSVPVVLLTARPTRRSAISLIAMLVLPSIVAAAVWGPSLLVDRLFLWPARHYVDVNWVSPAPWLLMSVVTMVLVGVARAAGAAAPALRLVAVAQVAMLASALTRADVDHLLFVAFPLPALAAVGFDGLRPAARRRWGFAAGALLVVTAAGCIARNVSMDRARRTVLQALRTNGVSRFHAEPFLAQLYFELRADNPYPHSMLLTGMHTDDQFAANLAVLARERPPFVLRNRSIVAKFRYDWSNPLDRWIDAHYVPTARVGDLEILAWRGS